ncbi:MAG: T9SS type A sorting domain-containing protein [Bacteroidota bacterium]|nr:T9SS type A sorting domain-containing protein [Bacteroidota bacterium]
MKFTVFVIIITTAVIYFEAVAQTPSCSTNVIPIGTLKGIKTDPRNPINPEKSCGKNMAFNWLIKDGIDPTFPNLYAKGYDCFTGLEKEGQILSPFEVTDTDIPYISLAKGINSDYYPEDGWEVLLYNMGKKYDGSTISNTLKTPFFILYNKYRGKMRLFMANNAVIGYGAVSVVIKNEKDISSSNYPSSFNYHTQGILRTLDVENDLSETSVMGKYSNECSSFFYVEFDVPYDPCVCNFKSRLEINIQYLKTGSIKLAGSYSGSIYNIANSSANSSEYAAKFGLGGLKIAGGATSGSPVMIFSGANDLFDAASGLNDTQSEDDKRILDFFKQVLTSGEEAAEFSEGNTEAEESKNKSDYYKKLFGSMSKYYNAQTKRIGNSKDKGITTMMGGQIFLEGVVNFEFEQFNDNIKMTLPGSKDSHLAPLEGNASNNLWQYPAYNEQLGVFAILNKPEIKYNHRQSFISSDFICVLQNDIIVSFNPILSINFEKTKVKANILLSAPGISTYLNPINNFIFNIDYQDNNKMTSISMRPHDLIGKAIGYFENYLTLDAPDTYIQLQIDVEYNDLGKDGLPIKSSFAVTIRPKMTPVNVPTNTYDYSRLFPAGYNTAVGHNNMAPLFVFQGTGNLTLNTSTYSEDAVKVARNKVTVLGNQDVLPNKKLVIIGGNSVEINGESSISGEVVITNDKHYFNGLTYNPDRKDFNWVQSNFCNSTNDNFKYKSNIIDASRVEAYAKNSNEQTPSPATRASLPTFKLEAIPNPAKGNTTFYYMLGSEGNVVLYITDILGRQVTVVEQANKGIGSYAIPYNTSELAEGVYLYTLEANGFKETKRLVVSK